MKYFLFIASFCLPVFAEAFVVADGNVELQNKQVLVESWEDQAVVTVTEVWHNPTKESQVMTPFLPLKKGAKPPEVFVNRNDVNVFFIEKKTSSSLKVLRAF